MRLTTSAHGLARAERMFADMVGGHQSNEEALLDRLPYVLDLLAGVTRTIDRESKGQRTDAFAAWWSSVDRSLGKSLTDIRNSELKALESRSRLSQTTALSVKATDYPRMRVADGDTVTIITWQFVNGPLNGESVIPVLKGYLDTLGEVLRDAEEKLAQ